MTLVDLIEIVVGNMVEFRDTGFMASNGAEFFETPYELVAIYNTNTVPYIVFNEEGTRYTQKNKGFISVKAEGKISRFIYSEALGIPYNKLENNQIILENNNKLMVELGADYYV